MGKGNSGKAGIREEKGDSRTGDKSAKRTADKSASPTRQRRVNGEQATADKLFSQRILILAHLVELKNFPGRQRPVINTHIIKATFKAIDGQGKDYDLIILDIMLPESEERLKRLRELEKELDKIRGVLRQEEGMDPDAESLRAEIEKAYDRRATILREKDTLINRRGGIELLEKLKEEGLLEELSPILVLTAVGNKEDVYQGMRLLSENGDWLVKPVSTQTLINKARELMRY